MTAACRDTLSPVFAKGGKDLVKSLTTRAKEASKSQGPAKSKAPGQKKPGKEEDPPAENEAKLPIHSIPLEKHTEARKFENDADFEKAFVLLGQDTAIK